MLHNAECSWIMRMRDRAISACAMLLVLVALAGAIYILKSDDAGYPSILNLSTDRERYQSREMMNIQVTVYAPSSGKELTLRIEGITDLMGRSRCQIEEQLRLDQGVHTFSYSYELPACSRCAGLPPGDYLLNATLLEKERVLSSMQRTVRLE